MTYRFFVTDALKAGWHLNARYADLIKPAAKTDSRSGDEIAADIIEKCGLRFE